ncbi:glycoprotein 3-alpha-L-fucosyltransferase A-like [Drosophila miranda]|uniref:glycoprotein 3-alpha-L-fucosyltransferase A-like n=1 Tax=Drosophila miranda TaxID=7229 RepID=UPI0007E6F24A|nr:glycoprotein 3-alpha-L-fucosyltransferase A-like [Drosophila miranda]
MRISYKKCIFFTLICAFLLTFCLNAKKDEGEVKLKKKGLSEKAKFDTRRSLKPSSDKPWYMKDGALYPQLHKAHGSRLEHHPFVPRTIPDKLPFNDHIVSQLMYVPHNYAEIKASGKLKTLLTINGQGRRKWTVKKGRDVFLKHKCPVDTCEITDDIYTASTADMILYLDLPRETGIHSKNPKQVSLLYSMANYVAVPEDINWTASYRRDSTIVTPYVKWVYYDPNVQQKTQDRNYAANKTKKVAWFVSNCNTINGRLKYALELQKYIEVDIYGVCGKFKCSQSTPNKCYKLLENNYKFYLAFENANCKDFISEKYVVYGLDRGVLPIVMGARPADYQELAPRHSYIHVEEYSSPKELADYLNVLDKDDDLYNSYFMWRGTGEFINTHFWCRVCAMLHNEDELRMPHATRLEKRGVGMCTQGLWKKMSRQSFFPDSPYKSINEGPKRNII